MSKFDEEPLFDSEHSQVYYDSVRELLANHRVELMHLINSKLEERGLPPLDETLL